MKIARLSSTEVANISALPIDRRREQLLKIEQPKVFWGYPPVERALPKLLLAESPLFGKLAAGSDEALLDAIERDCKSGPAQAKACRAVGRAIVDWRNANNVTGRVVHVDPLRTSVDTLKYCADVVAILDGEIFVIYLDPRSSLNLTLMGREFINSLIHHTALIGDLRDATPAILRTPKASDEIRRAVFEPMSGEPKFSLDEIMTRVTETYSIWETILRTRRAEGSTAESG